MRGFRAGLAFQLAVFRARLGEASMLVSIPFTTAVLLSVVRMAHRSDLDGAAILAPSLSGLWSITLALGGTSISRDRGTGMLELVVAAPASFASYLWGRMTACIAIGLVSFAETWLVGFGVYGARCALPHPGWFFACLAATAFATVSAGALIAAMVALSRNAQALPNILNYPIFVLAGVFTPVALLPHWMHPVARVFFLSWSSDLARASLRPEAVPTPWFHLCMIILLGLCGYLVGGVLIRRINDRLRATGRVSL